ncbi:MAG: hypothetical protein J6Y80_03275 [Victivallales bacterium]|nr:hypothetical protein [Victivallales bacterium]
MTHLSLGLDLGTTGIKAVLFDADGMTRGIGLTEYTLETPAPDFVELDAERYWEAAKSAIGQALTAAKAAPQEIASVGITGQAETLIVVDDAGRPLRKAIVWLDNRADQEAAAIRERFGDETLFRMSGQTEMLPCWPAAKLLWLRNHEPELFAKAARFLMVEDFVIARLCGKFVTCRGLMPSTLYFDIRTGEYDRAMLDFLGITLEQLPELRDAGEAAGPCIANDSPLLPGTVVSCGPIDHVCGNLGSGCTGEGLISETTGCSLALCASFPKPVYDEERRISTYLGFAPGSYVLLPWAPTAGMLLKHFRDEFSAGRTYDDLTREAAAIPPGSEGLVILPHCAGAVSPVCNPRARGVAYGVTLAHKRGHWTRAIMESVAYLLRDNVEVLRAMGCPLAEVRALGGAAKSPLWLQIMADVLQIPVTVTACEEATALGAAILGRVACGEFPTAAEGSAAMVRVKNTVVPDAHTAAYAAEYQRYRNLNNLLLPTF